MLFLCVALPVIVWLRYFADLWLACIASFLALVCGVFFRYYIVFLGVCFAAHSVVFDVVNLASPLAAVFYFFHGFACSLARLLCSIVVVFGCSLLFMVACILSNECIFSKFRGILCDITTWDIYYFMYQRYSLVSNPCRLDLSYLSFSNLDK